MPNMVLWLEENKTRPKYFIARTCLQRLLECRKTRAARYISGFYGADAIKRDWWSCSKSLMFVMTGE
jgi:hypothetical protein